MECNLGTGYCFVQLINYWVGEKYTLRYTGGMVPDVGQVRIVFKYSYSWYSNPLGPIHTASVLRKWGQSWVYAMLGQKNPQKRAGSRSGSWEKLSDNGAVCNKE